MKNVFVRLLIMMAFLGSNDSWAQIVNSQCIHIQHFDANDGLSESLVTGAIQDYEGLIWLATWSGLQRYDGYQFVCFKSHPGDGSPLNTNRIWGVSESPDHNIICWSDDKYYLFNRKTERFENCKNPQEIERFMIPVETESKIRNMPEYGQIRLRFLLIDNQQGIWVYSNRGLERLSLVQQPIAPQKVSRFEEESVRGFFKDKEQHVWISDKNGYVRRYGIGGEKDSVLYLSPQGNLSATPVPFGHNVYCFHEDRDGNIWLGTKPDGLFKLTPSPTVQGTYQVRQYIKEPRQEFSISGNSIYAIREDTSGRLLLATFDGGLNIVEQQSGGNLRFIHAGNLLKRYPSEEKVCRCIELLPDNVLLIGTSTGLLTASINSKYEDMVFHKNERKSNIIYSLSCNYINDLYYSSRGEIYVATSGGGTDKIVGNYGVEGGKRTTELLSNDIHFEHFSMQNGLSSDMNITICEDDDGYLWIISNTSLSKFDPNTKTASNYIRSFFKGRFLFNEARPICLSDGQLLIGTTQGVLRFNPHQIAKSSFVPHIIFNCEHNLKLEPDVKDFNIRFTAIDYNKNEDIVYAYKLEGKDKDWRYTRNHELNYVGLAPGTYRLHIKSTNGDGIWVDNEEVITLQRSAHFTETPYAWMLFGVLLALFLWGIWITFRYIRSLQRELKDVRLTSMEQIELLGARIKEMLPISGGVKEMHEDSTLMSSEDRVFAQKLKAYVEANISNTDLTVIDIAQEMNISRTALFVRMKHIFDSSPNNYVLNTRINYAKELLRQPNAHVSEVAYQCGFSDPKYFSRCFRKLTGKLPKDVRETHARPDNIVESC